MDMTVMEFWEMRLKYFFLKLHYHDRRKREDMIATANLVRMQTMSLVNIQLAVKDRFREPKKFWLFPWEEGEEKPEETKNINNARKLGDLLL